MFLFSCAYAYAYVACVMLMAQVGTRLYETYFHPNLFFIRKPLG